MLQPNGDSEGCLDGMEPLFKDKPEFRWTYQTVSVVIIMALD